MGKPSSTMPPKSTAQQQPPSGPDEQELTAAFRAKQNELQGFMQKIGDLEREAEEHVLVIETLKDAHADEPDRKCFRMVGGVLVERTVKDVLPVLEETHVNIKQVLKTLLENYQKKETDFAKWQRDNNISIKRR